jgi:hypothetical protein
MNNINRRLATLNIDIDNNILVPRLVDIQELYKISPTMYKIPDNLNNYKIGQNIKICDHYEYILVEIKYIEDSNIIGTIISDLIYEKDYKNGSMIIFDKSNIYG